MFTFKAVYWEPRSDVPGQADPASPGWDYDISKGDAYQVTHWEAVGVPAKPKQNADSSFRSVRIHATGDDYEIQVGYESKYAVVYVMNENGRTIDTVR